jgi:Icc-related predicted phosphoesterase
MKIQIVSDLHLEFLNFEQTVRLASRLSITSTAEILILAGDICSWRDMINLYTFLDILVDRYQEIIYVLDNHEYYGCSPQEVKSRKTNLEKYCYSNVSVLENESSSIEDITFYGTTLWFEENVDTSMNRYYMNDYRCIQDFNPDAWSRKAIQFIKNISDDESKKVLITHHIPHSRFISEKYVGNEMNCFYLNEIGKYLNKFDLVTFEHSHESVDYQFSDRCRAISNPRGYLKAPDTCISYSNNSSTEGSNDKFQYQLIVEV